MCLKHSFDKKEEEEKEKAAGRNQSLLTACTGAYEHVCAHAHMCAHTYIFIYKLSLRLAMLMVATMEGLDWGMMSWTFVIAY